MNFNKNKVVVIFCAFLLILSLASCKATKNANNKQKGVAIGAAGGAVLGAIIGNNVGKGGKISKKKFQERQLNASMMLLSLLLMKIVESILKQINTI